MPEGDARTAVGDALALDAELGDKVPGTEQGKLTAEIGPDPADPAGSVVTLHAENVMVVPFFGWFFGPVFRLELKRGLRWAAVAVRARVDGVDAPSPLGKHPLSTPGLFDQAQTTLIATVSFAGVITAFAAALFGQLSDPVAKSFHISDSGLGGALAVTRLGALIALVAAGLADRLGRRRILLGSVLGVCIASGLSAIAPNFVFFTIAQTLVRACVNAAVVVGGIAVVEEAPDGARAFAVSMLALASGAGYAFSVVLLPVADIGPSAWRVAFGIAALMAFLVPVLGRNLGETRRFEQLAERSEERGRFREVFDAAYGRRLALLAGVGFLSNVFSAPSAQLGNRYLRDERHFSNSTIALFKGVTNGIPGLAGILLAGRLSETRGRRPVAIVGMFLGTALTMVFFLGSGPVIWIASSLAIVASASGTLSVGTMDAELFPTEVRGTANALLLICYVAGSAVGLLAAGLLSDAIGDLGIAIAVCGVAPLVAAIFLLPRLPESSGRALDDVSPSEV
ncbi:MAG: MFS transporter [Acidimicrobiia bacterium]